MKIFQLVDKNKNLVNQVGANGWTLSGFKKPESFAVMQSYAFYYRANGVNVYLQVGSINPGIA